MVVGNHSLRKTEYALDQQYERQETQTQITSEQTNYDAHRVLALLAACLIEYRTAHRDAGLPPSLNALPPDLRLPQGTVCDARFADASSVPGYTFTYTPRQDASNSIVTGFLLVAMPQKKGAPRVDPMAVDSRGRIFSYVGWSVTDQNPEFVPRLVETPDDFQRSQVLGLREEIRLFMQTNGTPPAMLSKMSQYSDKSAYNEMLTASPYRLEYFPPTPDAPKAYMMSAVCQSYGDACLRSFLLDQNGEIHQTSEARRPTVQDPLIPDCEKYAQTCRDIDWPLPIAR